MNIKEYISGGFIENYVLGLASKEEREEFEQLCKQHPELIAARNEFELALEQRMLNQTVLPADGVKDKVMDAIRQQPTANQTRIITMENVNTTSSSSSARWVAAAAIILLLGAAFFAFKFYSENKKLREGSLAKGTTGGGADSALNAQKSELANIMADPKVAVVTLKGQDKAPNSSAKVLWDSTADNVYVVIKNMPKLQASDKQYQLWSIINGQNGELQPSDMGLFDVGDGKILLKVDQKVRKADIFAITVENRGNATGKPNLDQIHVLGNTPKSSL